MRRIVQPVLCLLASMLLSHAALSQSTYIYDPPGTLTGFANEANWCLDGNQSPCVNPANFSDADQIFVIDVTSDDAILDANWSVSGTGSKVVIGDGISSTTFIIPENFAYTGTIDVEANSTLEIVNNTVPSMGTLASSSTVIYSENDGSSNQVIAQGTYGNLTIEQATPIKELQNSIVVAGDLTFNDTEFTVTSPSTTLTLDGDLNLLQTVVLNSNLKTNLSITHNGNTVQVFSSDNAITIPCNSFSSTKTGGSLTLGSSVNLDVANNFTIFYTSGAAFNVDNTNSVTVGGTFTLEGDGSNDIPGGTYENLTLNLSSGNGILQGNAMVNGPIVGNGILTLTLGSIEVGSNNLTIGSGGSISGAGASNYIITNGGGELVLASISGTPTYPIGTAGSYNPVTIDVNSGTPTIAARVFGGVLTEGTSGTTVAEIDDLVNRTWSINSGSSFNVDLTFQWSGAEEGSTFDRASGVKIVRYSGGSWSDLTTPVGVSGPPYTVSASGVTSLSEFALGDAGSSLPVTWVGFSGKEAYPGIASLEWKTASELNNKGFEVQKSMDGRNFEMIGFVEGTGTTNETQTYGFADEDLRQNTYYRLRQIDFDGKFDYSRIIFVESSRHIAHPFSMYPNPVHNSTPIRLAYQLADVHKEQPLQLQLHDIRGTLLLTGKGTLEELNKVLNARLLGVSQGVYLLTLTDFATLTHVKVLKQ